VYSWLADLKAFVNLFQPRFFAGRRMLTDRTLNRRAFSHFGVVRAIQAVGLFWLQLFPSVPIYDEVVYN
jgi:hypothetical protein